MYIFSPCMNDSIIVLFSVNVTEFWKITDMGAPETIRIFEFSMALLIAEILLKIFLNSTCNFRH